MVEESAFKKQNLVLKDILNSSWDGIAMISPSFEFLYVNKALTPMFSYAQKDLLSMKFLDLLKIEEQNKFTEFLKNIDKNSNSNNINLLCSRSDDKIIYLKVSAQLMSKENLFILNLTDITENLATDNLINEYILKVQLDINANILKSTKGFNELTQYNDFDLLNINYLDILSSDTSKFQKESLIKSIDEKINWKGKLILNKKDKSTLNVNVTSSIDTNKYADVIGYTVIMTNTSSFTSEDEKTLKNMIMDGEEKLSIMSDTMRTVAHEWRQPLNSISLVAQELAFNLDFDEQIDKVATAIQLQSISDTTHELSETIDKFQAITDLSSQKKTRNIKEIINEAIKMAEINEETITITHNKTNSFRTYPKELALSISSILINAKEITSKIQNPNISIITQDDEQNIICQISNNGGHIPQDIFTKIFTPYFSTKEVKNGVGLSLYICKVIIELHLKGSIEVQNINENTVLFKLTFPKGALE